jgi:hypothetical protein
MWGSTSTSYAIRERISSLKGSGERRNKTVKYLQCTSKIAKAIL